MIKNIYDITLKLITPSEKGSLLDFTAKETDILEAVYFFNDKFRTWSKRIIVYMISKKSLHLLLFMEKEKEQEHITAREIRFFTTYLNNHKYWHEYSRNNSKLFESVNFSSCSLDLARQQISRININTALYEQQAEEIEFFKKESQKSEETLSGDLSAGDSRGITDDDIVPIINYLIGTRGKGINSAQKTETLVQIKEILKKWL